MKEAEKENEILRRENEMYKQLLKGMEASIDFWRNSYMELSAVLIQWQRQGGYSWNVIRKTKHGILSGRNCHLQPKGLGCLTEIHERKNYGAILTISLDN